VETVDLNTADALLEKKPIHAETKPQAKHQLFSVGVCTPAKTLAVLDRKRLVIYSSAAT